MKKTKWTLFALILLLLPLAHADGVVVSIKPLHSLVQSVMGGTGKARLLLNANDSPHAFSLKPSQAAMLHTAAAVFYIGDDFEIMLRRSLNASSAPRFAATAMNGVTMLKRREEDEHEHGKTEETHHAVDLHLWLSIDNAEKIAAAVAAALTDIYPQHQAAYAKNVEMLISRLRRLDAVLVDELAAVKDKPYLTFHDAYRYYEQHYGLNNKGVFAVTPATAMTAKQLATVKKMLRDDGIVCVFAEPQFPSRMVETMTRDSGVKSGILDPLGAKLPAGTDLYFQLMRNIAASLRRCLL